MGLTLYYHPLSSFCWKALIALYELGTPFDPILVDLSDETSRNAFIAIWPMGQFPVLKDEGRDRLIPQSTAIMEYLDLYRAYGKSSLIPSEVEDALEARRWTEFFDTYLQVPMQKIVGDSLRPEPSRDVTGVKDARRILRNAYAVLEQHLKARTWFAGTTFSIADCSACPALFYGNKVEPFEATHPLLAKYFEQLKARPSFARVLLEAAPYLAMFPYKG